MNKHTAAVIGDAVGHSALTLAKEFQAVIAIEASAVHWPNTIKALNGAGDHVAAALCAPLDAFTLKTCDLIWLIDGNKYAIELARDTCYKFHPLIKSRGAIRYHDLPARYVQIADGPQLCFYRHEDDL